MRRWLISLTLLAMGLALTAPAFAQTVLFGPKQYTRTAGPPNQFTDTFTLPAGATAPYTLHVVNGNANGTYTRTMKDGTVYQFNAQGYQTAKRDRNGNQTT